MTALAGLRNRSGASHPREASTVVSPTVDRLPDRSATKTDPVWWAPAAPLPVPPELAACSRSPGLSTAPWSLLVPSRRPVSGQLRTTHLVIAAVLTLAVIGGLGWLGQGVGEGLPADTAIVRVGAGETIWDVAQRVAPESDPRAVVARIRQLNRIEGSALQPGQQLRVPDGR